MDYIHNIRAAFNPAYTQLATDGVYLALPYTRSTIGVWSLQDVKCKVGIFWLNGITHSVSIKPHD